ncbi:MAG: hypothetical protein ACFFB3_12460, partial [Candidatus Hodarchaeota archaeon]
EGRASKDVAVAKELAQKLLVDWKLFNLRKRRFEDLKKLIELKDGLNSAGMGYILDFFVKIRRKFGSRVVYYSGDGAGYLQEPVTPQKEMESIDRLIDEILAKMHKESRAFTMEEVKKLLKIDEEQVRGEVASILLHYPEDSLNQKYVHFSWYERAVRLAFEAVDRNRFFFWATSPFFSLPFYQYAMLEIPEKYEQHFNLYRMFLERLDRNLLEIRCANWPQIGFLPVRSTYHLWPRIQEIVSKRLHLFPRRIQNMIRVAKEDITYNPQEKITNYQEMQLPSNLTEFISLDDARVHAKADLNDGRFFTLISIILFAKNLEDTHQDSQTEKVPQCV